MVFFLQAVGDDLWEGEMSDDEDGGLTPAELQQLTSGLNKVLYYLLVMLDHFSLKRSRESMEVTVQELVNLTHMETSELTFA